MPPSSKLIHRCAVRSWMSAAAAMSVAFSFNCHKPITSNHSTGRNLLSSKIELVQSVNMANCWPKRPAQGTQLKRCSPLSHRSRGSTASLPQRGHVPPAGQRNWRKSSAACRSSCRDGIRCFIGLLQRDVGNHIIPILSGCSCDNALLPMSVASITLPLQRGHDREDGNVQQLKRRQVTLELTEEAPLPVAGDRCLEPIP